MNIDLSHKSISELRFDEKQVSQEEALVASRVEKLKACYNRIECIIGLASLFNRLTHLDLAHNKLGSSIKNTSIWLNELPPSLQVLNLAHNDIRGFACEDVRKRNHVNSSNVSSMIQASIAPLRLAFPLILALFFNRYRFPYLCELDLSYNAFALTLSDSDTAEENWQEVIERPLAASAPDGIERTTWLQYTTSSILVLRLNGNSHLTALNAMLCGMDSVTHIYAMGTGLADLTAVSSAATLCPKLRVLDMRDSPVVDAFIHAPHSTIATFIELLLLPSLLKGSQKGNERQKNQEEEESRNALHRVVREVAHKHIEDIESAIVRQQGCKDTRLSQVLYAALLQQVIPQVTELDAGMNVAATCQVFMNAAKEVLFHFIENNNRIGISDGPLRQSCKSSLGVKNPTGGEENNNNNNNNKRWDNEEFKQQQRQPPLCDEDQKIRNIEDSVDTSFSSHVDLPRKSSPIIRKRSGLLPNSDSVSGPVSGRERRERSRSAHGVSAAAAAAAAAVASSRIRPAVFVTSSTTNTSTATNSENNNNSSNNINGSLLPIRREHTDGGIGHSVNASSNSSSTLGVAEGMRRAARVGQNGETSRLLHSRIVHSPHATIVQPSSEVNHPHHYKNNNNKNHNNTSNTISNDTTTTTTTTTNNNNNNTINSIRNVSSNEGDDGSSMRGGRFQQALAALTPLLWERLEEDSQKGRLAQRARELEEALVASQDRQRGLQNTVAALRDQLQQDRHLITDQRKEAARLREQVEHLATSNKRTRRRLQKRQKEIAYGTVALQRREAVAQRRDALRQLQEEEKSLQQAERRLREKVAISGVCSHLQQTDSSAQTGLGGTGMGSPKQLRKTRADILRENAVRERLEAMKKEDPLAYNARRFRFDEYSFDDDIERGNSSAANFSRETSSFQRLQKGKQGNLLQLQQSDKKDVLVKNNSSSWQDERVHGKTPWRRMRSNSTSSHTTNTSEKDKEPRSMYDKGYSPYSDNDDDNNNNNNTNKKNGVKTNHGNGFRSSWLQELSLQQLFEEAAAMRKRQQVLQQRMLDVGGDRSVDTTEDMEFEEADIQHQNVVGGNNNNNNNNNNIGMTIGKNTPSTCAATVQENRGPASFFTADETSWSNFNDTSNKEKDDKVQNNNDDDDVSVDVVVSVAECMTIGDFMVTVEPSSTIENEEYIDSHNNNNNNNNNNHYQEQQEEEERQTHSTHPQKKEVVSEEEDYNEKGKDDFFSSATVVHATKGHFSVDAQSIYAEILRQQQRQQNNNLNQINKVVPNDEGEPSPITAALEGTAVSEDGKIFLQQKDVEDNNKSNIVDENTDPTRRTLFA